MKSSGLTYIQIKYTAALIYYCINYIQILNSTHIIGSTQSRNLGCLKLSSINSQVLDINSLYMSSKIYGCTVIKSNELIILIIKEKYY